METKFPPWPAGESSIVPAPTQISCLRPVPPTKYPLIDNIIIPNLFRSLCRQMSNDLKPRYEPLQESRVLLYLLGQRNLGGIQSASSRWRLVLLKDMLRMLFQGLEGFRRPRVYLDYQEEHEPIHLWCLLKTLGANGNPCFLRRIRQHVFVALIIHSNQHS